MKAIRLIAESLNWATSLNNQTARLRTICGNKEAEAMLKYAKEKAKKKGVSVESVLIEFENAALRG